MYVCMYVHNVCCVSSAPGPAQLDMVINAISQVTSANRPIPPSKQKKPSKNVEPSPSPSVVDPASVNAVVRLLEGRTKDMKKKWQCKHCSYIQTSSCMEGSECEMCQLPMVSQAPFSAVTSPVVMREALQIRDNVSQISSTTISHARKQQESEAKRCSICESLGVEKYCSSCE